jgi:hypothetical protein
MSLNLKVNEDSLRALEDNTRKAFEKVIRNKELLNDIGETIITDIKFQTRRGNSIPTQGKLKPLTSKWKDKRANIADQIKTGEAYSKNRSNLTLSGQLLDSLKTRIKGAGQIIIEAVGSRTPYLYSTKKTVKSRKQKHEPTNEELAQYVKEQGRPFLGIRDAIKDRIKKDIIAFIRRSSRVLDKINKR